MEPASIGGLEVGHRFIEIGDVKWVYRLVKEFSMGVPERPPSKLAETLVTKVSLALEEFSRIVAGFHAAVAALEEISTAANLDHGG